MIKALSIFGFLSIQYSYEQNSKQLYLFLLQVFY